ncbi:MAG: hypothetical protein R3F34_09840 [Planctomycetota bacterium]
MGNSYNSSLLALVGAALVGSVAHAQSTVRPVPRIALPLDWSESSGAAVPTEDEARRSIDVELHGTYLPAAGTEFGGGEVSTQRMGWSATIGRELEGGARAALRLSTEASFYDLSSSAPFVGGSTGPFNDVYETRLGGTYYAPFAQDIDYFGGFERCSPANPTSASPAARRWAGRSVSRTAPTRTSN